MSELGVGHVQPDFLESGQNSRYVWLLWDFWFVGMIQEFTLHQLTQCISLDSTELLGLK
jgi:hypothetical protein